jgi:hypothetical protein
MDHKKDNLLANLSDPNLSELRVRNSYGGPMVVNLCYVMLFYVMLCYLNLCYVMLCYVMWPNLGADFTFLIKSMRNYIL